MSKLTGIALLLLLVTLANIFCGYSVLAHRGHKNHADKAMQRDCKCSVLSSGGLLCKKKFTPRTKAEFNNVVACLCKNYPKYMDLETCGHFHIPI